MRTGLLHYPGSLNARFTVHSHLSPLPFTAAAELHTQYYLVNPDHDLPEKTAKHIREHSRLPKPFLFLAHYRVAVPEAE